MSLINRAVTPGQPAILTTSGYNNYFPQILVWPATLVNQPAQIRGRGTIIIPAGLCLIVGIGLYGIISPGIYSNPITGDSTAVALRDTPVTVPWSFTANMWASPFSGYLSDVVGFSGTGKFANSYPQSGAFIGTDSRQLGNSDPGVRLGTAMSFGSGTWQFGPGGNDVPLQVSIQVNGPSSPSYPRIMAQMTVFEIEYN